MAKVITRFPPSPTGYFHIGSARTALFNYLFTAREGGVMYLRFEDTDRERCKKEFEEDIIAGLDWLKIPYTSAVPLRQSERLSTYREYLRALIEKGAAYEAEEAEGGNGSTSLTTKGRVVRFKNPNTRITFNDLIRGDVSFDTTELKDFVIARNVDDPLYHMAVVADDHDMGVTHVIRGEDHISNTPRQILILEALGFERPVYAHIPLIHAPDRSKLSKRHGAVSINEYRSDGYLPEALVNYLALLGWTPPSGREKMPLADMVAEFDLKDVHAGGAIFDIEKLRWLNRQYILEMPDERIQAEIELRIPEKNSGIAAKLVSLVRERIHLWGDIDAMAKGGEFDYFFSDPALDISKVPGKGSDAATARRHLARLRELLSALPSLGNLEPEQIKKAIWDYAEAEGRGNVLWPLRYALTGKERSPDPFTVAAIIGRDSIERRIETAISALENRS
ncbi:hypothetical protein A3A39_03670 [Candidatus Kaiserbacteria bacterium RIFCSPLOWO2_01_FULL_54_13]|uniref:Glutamate--tRNA ligase n=1 Tax=Candidatus Kaiserbacteria bacterium RIFCSPLOWO2_01_FULL_54_13 TaxID=1798512 RepID=A0A1F6EZZ8_9BACT|nr:MAG: hypothetical protein A3A39_03670 [Candidatus Kaiserbacteria bacterium RIFCSPLOWO2_01_FULL_54_13]